LSLKSVYQFSFVHLAVIISNTSSGLIQQMEHLTNIWPLGWEIVEALLDQSNERVVPTELATGPELLVHVPNVLTASL
jgi:hypothetical protein